MHENRTKASTHNSHPITPHQNVENSYTEIRKTLKHTVIKHNLRASPRYETVVFDFSASARDLTLPTSHPAVKNQILTHKANYRPMISMKPKHHIQSVSEINPLRLRLTTKQHHKYNNLFLNISLQTRICIASRYLEEFSKCVRRNNPKYFKQVQLKWLSVSHRYTQEKIIKQRQIRRRRKRKYSRFKRILVNLQFFFFSSLQ